MGGVRKTWALWILKLYFCAAHRQGNCSDPALHIHFLWNTSVKIWHENTNKNNEFIWNEASFNRKSSGRGDRSCNFEISKPGHETSPGSCFDTALWYGLLNQMLRQQTMCIKHLMKLQRKTSSACDTIDNIFIKTLWDLILLKCIPIFSGLTVFVTWRLFYLTGTGCDKCRGRHFMLLEEKAWVSAKRPFPPLSLHFPAKINTTGSYRQPLI